MTDPDDILATLPERQLEWLRRTPRDLGSSPLAVLAEVVEHAIGLEAATPPVEISLEGAHPEAQGITERRSDEHERQGRCGTT